jgi:succinyl-diaminopimelate desuccinylase
MQEPYPSGREASFGRYSVAHNDRSWPLGGRKGAADSLPDMPELDLDADVVSLTVALCDIASVSQDEDAIATAIDTALRPLRHLTVTRHGNTVVARTELGRAERVVLAGHIDTVPLTDPPNLPTQRVGDELVGRGTVDMKGGVAVQLKLAQQVREPSRDLTYVFYESEEIDGEFNGLAHLASDQPDVLDADFAVLLEPSNGAIEGGCKGTLRAEVVTKGIAAHSARPWKGHNAIHDAGEVLRRLTAYEASTVTVDGLDYHEALQAVGIQGGIAGNVIPDRCVVTVNYRYAPDKSAAEAEAHVRGMFQGFEVVVGDNAPGACPGLTLPAAKAFVDALGLPVNAKEGWTDVARFSALGVPAVNFGPGDPNLAHTDDERAPVHQYVEAEQAMLRWLG